MNLNRFFLRNKEIVTKSIEAFRIWKSLNDTTKNRIYQILSELRPIEFRGQLVRIGSKRDGGYVVPSNIFELQVCFSPGVGPTCEFEMALATAGIRSYCCDGSIEKMPEEHELINFENQYLSAYPKDNHLTLEAWVESKLSLGERACLQMDIEGDEWEILCNSSRELLTRFDVLIIEFHDFHQILSTQHRKLYSSVLEKLHSSFAVLHFNPNNYGFIFTPNCKTWIPSCFEITLLNKKLLQKSEQDLATRKSATNLMRKRNDKYWFKYPVPW